MLLKTKLIIAGIVFVAWTAGVALVTQRFVSYSHVQKDLEVATQVLETVHANAKVADDIDAKLQAGLADYFATAKPITKEIIREVTENHIYTDCKSTDGVMRNYRDKLSKQ